jgi:Bacterial conjugation TrbI-like protein
MNQHSMSSGHNSQDVINLKTDNYQLEIDASDWEAHMEKLVGFEEESSYVNAEVLEDLPSLQQSSSTPQEVRTEQKFSSNPFAKLGLVGTATLSIVLLAGLFLSQMMSVSNQKPSKNNVVSSEVRTQPKSETHPQELEIETLKTKLALTEQAEDVKSAQQKLRSLKFTSPNQLIDQSSDSSRNRLRMLQPKIPTPVQTVYVPRIVTVTTPEKQLITKLPSPPLQQPVVKPETQPLNITPSPTPNPLQEWTKLAKLGSYGQVSIPDQSNINPTVNQPQKNPAMEQKIPNIQNQPTPVETSSLVSQAQQKNPKSIAVGTSVKAVLATAVFGETTKSRDVGDKEKNVFVVRLQEPLKAVDGSIVIPAKTEFLTEISSLSEQGFLEMNVVKMILQDKDKGNLTEQSLPPNTILIRAPQGKPLIAKQFPNQSSAITSMDVGLFILGGLGKAAELFNRTESQVVTTNTTGSIVSNTNPKRNALAGIFEGGINTIVPQIAQRNQQAISQMMQRTNIWFLQAGTEVEIYVNKMTQF